MNLDYCIRNKETIKVKIKSEYSEEFVVVEYDDYLYATGNKPNKNGVFILNISENGNVKIKLDGGDYIRLDNKNFLIADTDKEGATKFKVYKVDNKLYVLKAPNGYYVRVREDDKRLAAKAEGTGEKTRFKFKEVD
ncbi:fascin domain-containing protein [Paraclostridium bifermentans]|uniref:fascin domain-containing protein n=1 Tax=Paraclostridium bifermentans TaxID=1490 RepID=UPI00359CB53E